MVRQGSRPGGIPQTRNHVTANEGREAARYYLLTPVYTGNSKGTGVEKVIPVLRGIKNVYPK